jgi:hypothetical protein
VPIKRLLQGDEHRVDLTAVDAPELIAWYRDFRPPGAPAQDARL